MLNHTINQIISTTIATHINTRTNNGFLITINITYRINVTHILIFTILSTLSIEFPSYNRSPLLLHQLLN